MKNIKYSVFILLLTVLGCTKDLDSINTNPNAPIEANPSLLLRKVLYDYGEQMSYEGFVAGNLLGQYFTEVDFNLFDRHSLTEPQLGGNPWVVLYSNLRDNEILLDYAQSNPTFAVYEGPSLILKAYMTAALTDIRRRCRAKREMCALFTTIKRRFIQVSMVFWKIWTKVLLP